MTCDEMKDAMQRDLDGDLTAEERQRMRGHLLNCPRCVPLYERLCRLSSQLERLPKVQPPYSVVDALLPRLEQMPLPAARKTQRREGVGRRLLLGVSGSVAVVLIGVMAVVADMREGPFVASKSPGVLRADPRTPEPAAGATAWSPPREEGQEADRAIALGVPAESHRPSLTPVAPRERDEKGAPLALLPSPDGQWQAAVVAEGNGKRVVVYDGAGAERFRGHSLSPAARVTLQWEGKALVYDVVAAQNGGETAERWRVDVAAGTEERLTEPPRP